MFIYFSEEIVSKLYQSIYWTDTIFKLKRRKIYPEDPCSISVLTAVKEGIQSYWDKVYACNSFNQMWILKYCKDLLDRFFSFLT
jgi:hypothetical protein